MNSIRYMTIKTLLKNTVYHREFGSKHHHTPLIKFVGKREKHEAGNHASSASKTILVSSSSSPVLSQKASSPAPAIQKPIKSSPNAVEFHTLKGKAMFGRPKFYDDEVEAILSGGATAV